MDIKTIKQFVRFCYDDIAEELGFTRIGNGYYKVLEYCIIGFGISRSGYTNFLKVNFDIIPLSGELYIGDTLCNMNDISKLYFINGKESFAGLPVKKTIVFSASLLQEQYQMMKDAIIYAFEVYQKPIINHIHDLTSAYAIREGWEAFFCALDHAIPHGFSLEDNHVHFLLELKDYDVLLNDYKKYELWYKDSYGANFRWDRSEVDNLYRSLIMNREYDTIEVMLDKRRMENVKTLFNLSKGRIDLPKDIRDKYLGEKTNY